MKTIKNAIMKKISVFLITILIIACSENKDRKVEIIGGFPKEVSLTYTVIKTPPVLFYVGEMILLDNILVTIDMKSDTIFRQFRLPEFRYAGGFIKRGRGPGEETYVEPYIQPLSESAFLYRSVASANIVTLDLRNRNIRSQNKIKLSDSLETLQHVFLLPDSLICGSDLVYKGDNKEFVSYDFKKNSVKSFGSEYSNIITNLPPKTRASLFSKVITVKPDKSSFAAVYDKFMLLRIFSNKGILLHEVQFLNSPRLPNSIVEGDMRNINPDEIFMQYQKIQSTNKYIYALYSGKPLSYVSRSNQGIADVCNEIHVWTWQGKPILKISLDNNISSFVVSSDNSYLICYTSENLDKFYKYDLNSFK